MADGLSTVWNKNFFGVTTTDLWEETARQTSVRMENNFTYTLAACARGLFCANEIIANHFWKEVALQMMKKIEEAYSPKNKYYYRNFGKIPDPNIDASLLGLVWPFNICEATDEKMINTVKRMEDKIVLSGGVHRYQFDYFDSEGSAQEGGGGWPVLNFWMTIYWCLKGDKSKALQYYNWVVDRADKFHGYLPEQYFPDFRIGIYPLAWSHAMFIIASHYLGYL
jgi:GH15 family glucan-1,4-alpha-glucosidase